MRRLPYPAPVHSAPWLGAGALLLVLASGCSGSAMVESAVVNGTLGGRPFVAQSVVQSTVMSPFDTGWASVVQLATFPDYCADWAAGTYERPNAGYLTIGLTTDIGYGRWIAATQPGTFIVQQNPDSTTVHLAQLYFSANDASCSLAEPDIVGVSGTVTVTWAGKGPDGGMSGTFDVTMSDGEHVSGSFNAVGCPALGMVAGSAIGDGGIPGACS